MSSIDEQSVDAPPQQGRGGIILGLGIVALLFLGPIGGIPAWMMGHRDLKRIKSGELSQVDKSLTQTGMVLGIIGTFVSPVFLIVGSIVLAIFLSLSRSHSLQESKDAMMTEASHIAQVAHEYRRRPSGAAGGGGSYMGFTLSEQLKHTARAKYYVRITSPDQIQIVGMSIEHEDDGLVAEVDENGSIVKWIFSGGFEPNFPFRFRRKLPENEESRQHGTGRI